MALPCLSTAQKHTIFKHIADAKSPLRVTNAHRIDEDFTFAVRPAINAQMRDQVSYFKENIDQRRHRLQELDREKIAVSAELRVFEDMLLKFTQDEAPIEPVKAVKASALAAGGSAFQMSKEWKAIFKALDTRGRQFDAADIILVGQSLGFTLTTPSVRSQFAHYTKRGYLRKVLRGKYSITPKGRERFAAEGGETNRGHSVPKGNEDPWDTLGPSEAGGAIRSPLED